MSNNPYKPPIAGSEGGPVPHAQRPCPNCGGGMTSGFAKGDVSWLGDERSFWSKFFLGEKRVVGARPFTITLRKTRTPGLHCINCGLIMLFPPR